jgi:hypothetical protein
MMMGNWCDFILFFFSIIHHRRGQINWEKFFTGFLFIQIDPPTTRLKKPFIALFGEDKAISVTPLLLTFSF